jgi:hypothetical protein
LAAEVHVRHFRRATRFALIAGLARAYHVLPGMFAAEAAWDNVVYGELPSLFAAVLAGVIISKEYLASAHLSLCAGAFNHVNQADH